MSFSFFSLSLCLPPFLAPRLRPILLLYMAVNFSFVSIPFFLFIIILCPIACLRACGQWIVWAFIPFSSTLSSNAIMTQKTRFCSNASQSIRRLKSDQQMHGSSIACQSKVTIDVRDIINEITKKAWLTFQTFFFFLFSLTDNVSTLREDYQDWYVMLITNLIWIWLIARG